MTKLCKQCKSPLAPDMRAGAVFCKPTCKAQWHRDRVAKRKAKAAARKSLPKRPKVAKPPKFSPQP